MPPQRPPSSEIIWLESTGSAAARGSKRVESIVKSGLVRPTVKMTRKSAIFPTSLRGSFMTGESCEILSNPEKARNDPAKPTSRVTGVRACPRGN
jgi:hypothetical protein